MHKKTRSLSLALAVALLMATASACQAKLDGVAVRNTGHYAIVDTDKGTFVIELYPKVAPKTVENFVALATGTKEWLDPRDGRRCSSEYSVKRPLK